MTVSNFYIKILQPALEKELKGYFLDRFGFIPSISFDLESNIGTIGMDYDKGLEPIFLSFCFLDSYLNECSINDKFISVYFMLSNFTKEFVELSNIKDINFYIKHGTYIFIFNDDNCHILMDNESYINFFVNAFIFNLGLKEDYDKYLENLKGEEVF